MWKLSFEFLKKVSFYTTCQSYILVYKSIRNKNINVYLLILE